MEYRKLLSALEDLIIHGSEEKGDVELIRSLIGAPQTFLENAVCNLQLALGTAVSLYQAGGYESAAEIIAGVLRIDGIKEVGSYYFAPYHAGFLTTLDEVMGLCLLRMNRPDDALEYAEEALANISSCQHDDKFEMAVVDCVEAAALCMKGDGKSALVLLNRARRGFDPGHSLQQKVLRGVDSCVAGITTGASPQCSAPMITFRIHLGIRVVGELTDQGHELPWRRRARLYMEPPAEWPVPKGFLPRLDDGRIRLNGEVGVVWGKVIGEDWNRIARQINWYYCRVQETYWNDLFAKGIVFALVTQRIDPEIRASPAPFLGVEMRLLVPKGRAHRKAGTVSEMVTELNQSFVPNLWLDDVAFFPLKPEDPNDYDEFVLDRIDEMDYIDRGHLPRSSNTPFLTCFETVRKAVDGILKDDETARRGEDIIE